MTEIKSKPRGRSDPVESSDSSLGEDKAKKQEAYGEIILEMMECRLLLQLWSYIWAPVLT